jgi:hypothetical protein
MGDELSRGEALDRAAMIYINVPGAGTTFSFANAVLLAGITPKQLFDSSEIEHSVETIVARKTQGVVRSFPTTDDGKLDRVCTLYRLIVKSNSTFFHFFANWSSLYTSYFPGKTGRAT